MPKYIFFPVYQGGEEKATIVYMQEAVKKKSVCVYETDHAFSEGVKDFFQNPRTRKTKKSSQSEKKRDIV